MRGKKKKGEMEWGNGARVNIFFTKNTIFFGWGGEGVQLVKFFLQRIQT